MSLSFKVAGIIYCAGLLGLGMVTGGRLARPSERVQFWVGAATLTIVQLVLAVVACIHRLTARQLG